MKKTLFLISDDVQLHSRLTAAGQARGWRVRVSQTVGRMVDAFGVEGLPSVLVLDLDSRSDPADAEVVAHQCGANGIPFMVVAGPAKLQAWESDDPRVRCAMGKAASDAAMWIAISATAHIGLLEREVACGGLASASSCRLGTLVAGDPAMDRVLQLARRAAKSTIPVLLEGEPGTGKRSLATAIHAENKKRRGDFVRVDCRHCAQRVAGTWCSNATPGIPAFSSASVDDVAEFVRSATRGTLYLDEVSALSPSLQEVFLRALQSGTLSSEGGRRKTRFDCRIIASTSQDLVQCVQDGSFREDLYFAISVYPLSLPPLRSRKEDLFALIAQFLERSSAENARDVDGVAADAMAILMEYDWPGNISQLENSVFRAVTLSSDRVLDRSDFPQIVAAVEGPEAVLRDITGKMAHEGTVFQPPEPEAIARLNGDRSPGDAPHADHPTVKPVENSRSARERAMKSARYGRIDLIDEDGNIRNLEEIERSAIEFAVNHLRGNITSVARQLGIGRSTLYRKLRGRDVA